MNLLKKPGQYNNEFITLLLSFIWDQYLKLSTLNCLQLEYKLKFRSDDGIFNFLSGV